MKSNTTNRAEGTAKEIGGAIKKNVGKLVGSEKIEAQGRAKELEGKDQKERAKTVERTKGKIDETVGAAQNRVGQLIDDEEMAAKGKAKELGGKARQKANQPN